MVLHVDAADIDLQFSSLVQLDHFIEVMMAKPLPTSRQLSRKRELPVGPNSHWLSRLPAKLKAPKERAKLVVKTRLVIHAFPEQFRAFLTPFLECLNGCFMLERPLRNVVVVDLDVIAQRRFQLGS
jgi:hypothetical protein